MIVLPVKMAEAKEASQNFFIELYKLWLPIGEVRIAACDEDIVFNGETYTAVPFQRESLTRSMDNIVDSCNISLGDCNYDMLSYVVNGYDFRGSAATIFRIMYPDSLSDPTISEWVFSGYIDEPSYSNGVFTCKIESRFPQIDCPNRCYQLACNSEFGDAECSITPRTVSAKIVSVNGNEMVIDTTETKGYWNNGVAIVGGEARVVETSEGNRLTLNVNFLQDGIVGKTVQLTQGCNKTQERCRYYGNLQHYGGFPAIPFESVYR